MKKAVLFASLLLLSAVLIVAFKKRSPAPRDEKDVLKELELKRWTAIGCGSAIDIDEIEKVDMPLLSGWGHYSFPVTTSSDSAQLFFDQGLSMYYAFHIIEALGSFKKAAALDPSCAMAWWGQALALGPNINDYGYSASPEALDANAKALANMGSCTEREKALIQAMQVRYSADTNRTRQSLDQQYVDAMKALTETFPVDADVWALYADALMVQHPWDLYEQNGSPKPWTPHIAAVLEHALQLSPQHPGANHYYIHTIEGSLDPYKALPSARVLSTLMPAVSHMVHMPSHIYIRTGNYAEGQTVNEMAVKGYDAQLKSYQQVSGGYFLYVVHNLHLQANCAFMEGRYAYADSVALSCRKSVDTSYMDAPGYSGTYSQYVWMTPMFNKVRFGKWEDVLQEPATANSRSYAAVIRHFGRGIALARTHRTDEALKELDALRLAMKDSVLLIAASTFNPPIAGARVAERLLEGVIAEERNDAAAALESLNKAVALEDAMMYGEPKDWPLPARQYLGKAQLHFNKYEAAIQTLKADLRSNPNNGWALYGIWQAHQKLKQQQEAAAAKRSLDKAFARYDLRTKAVAF